MNIRRIAASTLLLLLALACGGLGLGDTYLLNRKIRRVAVISAGVERFAWVHIPRRGARPAPLVLVMRGDDAGVALAWLEHFDARAVIAFPDSPAGVPAHIELHFLRDLVDHLDDETDIDRSQVYLAGFSTGGQLTWRASCEDPEPYAAFAVVGAPADLDLRTSCAPSVKRPVIYLHEEEASHDDTRSWLLGDRRCGEYPFAKPLIQAHAGRWGRGQSYACRTVHGVELWTVSGADGCWPTQDTCAGLDASRLITDFWRRQAGFGNTP